ncbi:MAG: O-antigen ligase family protein [Bryobacteraceae bacterium]
MKETGAQHKFPQTPEQAPFRIGVLRVRLADLPWKLLFRVAVCLVPPALALAIGRPRLGTVWLYGTMTALCFWYLIKYRDIRSAAVIAVSCIPAMMFLRRYFLFSSVSVVLVGLLVMWALLRWRDVRTLRQNPAWLLFVCGFTLYWLVAVILTGNYSANLRSLELIGSASLVALLSTERRALAAALLGMCAGTWLVGLGLLPHSAERLGEASVSGETFGNATTFGIPAALAFLLTITHGGRWVLLRDRPVPALWLAGLAAGLLLLSGSRGSWLVAFVGVAVALALDHGRRQMLAGSLVPLALCGILVLGTTKGAVIQQYFERATAEDRSWSKRTTGRSDQWEALYRNWHVVPPWGFGPASGEAVHARFLGHPKVWHSLYLQTMVETGLIGIGILMAIFAILLSRAYRHWVVTQELIPLQGVLCYLTIGLSVTGIDASAGLYLGLGFVAGQYDRLVVLKRHRAHVVRPVRGLQ